MIDSNLLTAESTELDWVPVGDPVMGGRSDSRIVREGDALVFHGTVSFENSGGFSSIESPIPEVILTESTGVELRVVGDGKTYRFRVKTGALRPGESYQCSFETQEGQLLSVRLAYSELEATRRGRPAHLPELDPGRINRVGFMIADEQEGPFRLEVKSLRPIS